MFFFFKQKTAYEMRISDWSSDVCSSDLEARQGFLHEALVDGDGVLPLQRVEELLEDVVLQRGGELAFDLVEAGVTVLLRRRQDLLELGDDLADRKSVV